MRLKKDAAIITPPAIPKRASMTLRFTFLKKKTKELPAIVKAYVIMVAKNACKMGFKFEKNSIIFDHLIVGYDHFF